MSPLAPGATIGILGGGQLGRLIALAAARLGLKTHVFSDDPDSPAFAVAAHATHATYEDEAALEAFSRSVSVVTYEFENVPARAAEIVSRHAVLRPGARALATTQDRLAEKSFVAGLGLATAPFRGVEDEAGLAAALAAIGAPAVLKTRRFGYDGKGQVTIRPGDDAAAAFAAIGRAPAILEGFVPFAAELSIVAARGLDGGLAAYEACENEHERHILAETRVPAAIGEGTRAAAADIARAIGDALDYVGIFAVELFLVRAADGAERLLVNEIAPRVHNSGHWTDFGAQTSQFEQHVRAIAGWPLGATKRLGRAVSMKNLIGDAVETVPALLAEEGAHVTLYGKAQARAGRKMGHVTRIAW